LTSIEVFVKAFALGRAFTHPCDAQRVGPLWVIRDAPRKRATDYRREEWVAHHVAPPEVDATARREARGRFCICAMRDADEPDQPLRDAYRALGYRLGATEALMRHSLARVPRVPQPIPVMRVLTPALADRLAKTVGRRQILPEHLTPDAPIRAYAALAGKRIVGWVRSIVVGDSTWVSNLHVAPKFRRQGIGRAMLAQLLRDDRAGGSRQSVLLASHVGAMLYPTVGYEQVGDLLLYTPRKT
jgi:GNAT superfamily N-acetyltransferase